MPLNKAKGRMFKSVGWTWNPIVGCTHNCKYCWAESLRKRWGKPFKPALQESAFKDKFPNDGSWIFVGSMGDLFCEGMKHEWIRRVLDKIAEAKNNSFLLQTKNPSRLYDYLLFEQDNNEIIAGTTLETTLDTPWSTAPHPKERYYWLREIKEKLGFKTFLSLEPLADYEYSWVFKAWIHDIQPEAVEIGLENYTNYVPKPPEKKILNLINFLKGEKIPYILKENLRHLEETVNE